MKRRPLLIGLCLVLWLATSACSCLGILDSPRSARESETSQSVVTATSTWTPTPPLRATPVPPTRAPSRAEPTPVSDGLPTIPAEPDTPFVIEMTQDQVNEYLRGATFQEGGVRVSDPSVVLTSREIVCSFQAWEEEWGLGVGITVRGMPTTSDGMAYFKVDDVALDDSLKGFNRLIAKAAVESAIKQYSTPLGIPIPIDEVVVQRIELMPGSILIVGRTR